MTKRSPPKRATVSSWFSRVIREWDEYRCQVCGRSFRGLKGLSASHHVPQGGRGALLALAWDLDNATAKCDVPGGYPRGCHAWMDAHPLHHAEWIRDHIGEERYQALKVRSVAPPKMTPELKMNIYEHLKSELKRMEALRRDGVTGTLTMEASW